MQAEPGAVPAARLSTGIPGLDDMLGGGLPPSSCTLIQGGSGTGKTLLSLSFLVEGARKGEPGLMIALEETREALFRIGADRGWPLEQLDQQGLLKVISVPPLELAGDILLQRIRDWIDELGVRRAVLDSIATFSLSIFSEGRLKELVYAAVKTFTVRGVTVVLTNEIPELVGTGQLTGRGFSSIVDNIILFRFVELEARLLRAITVLKIRGSRHDNVLRELIINDDSISVLEAFSQFRGVLTGVPTATEGNAGRRRRGRSRASQD